MPKYGSVKRQHGRIAGLDILLDKIVDGCPHVTRIVPGRIGRKKGKTRPRLRLQYATGDPATGLKCIYSSSGSWQEVFLVTSDAEAARDWLVGHGFVEAAGAT